MLRFRTLSLFALLLFALLLILPNPSGVFAQTAGQIQTQIDQHNQQITDLQSQIAEYQKELDATSKQKSTLQSAVNSLALEQKQLSAQLSVTQNKIDSANLEIQKLTLSIGDAQDRITSDENAVGKALRDLATGGEPDMLAQFFGAPSLADAWTAADQADSFNRALAADIRDLGNAKQALSDNRDAVAATKSQLLSLQSDLTTQKRSIDANKAAEQALLAETKSKEANYQKLIADKQASEKQFEAELVSLQSQLNLIVNPGSLPKAGSGVLAWPFSASFMDNCAARASVFGNSFCITQYFGNTAFATQNPQVYSGHGHDGIDIAAPIGTPVHAALSGVVYGTGNTDAVYDSNGHRCYSFGKWVMLKHGNGLNTMYAHLSEIDVSVGQPVTIGDVIGLSGMTGYATGPHLHFGVYATEGTKIMTLKQFRGATTGCANASMPVATLDAYLNPLSYL
ncbi:MAG: peptidoglycan DD-metalloendopeptidase family protein [Patescibacteria group bacterium]|nr:peptidoglycan DD-metalloendopeptidase family protein [Patescibacteria group bacterium]MDE1965940.1 peptidoglycan DD-metalloendopeptidase family protein [Patescibacteria group bacterium]